jgi:beta-glucosidase
MASFNSWNGAKLHGHRHLLSDVLVGELGFKGFVVSDWKGIEQLPGGFSEQIERSVEAGIDMLMQPDNYEAAVHELKALAERGQIPPARIDEAVRRILTVKVQMGLFERPFGDSSLLPKVGSAEHRAVARRAVRESQVLLVNRQATLPLRATLSHILVAGKSADDVGIQSGGWTIIWQGSPGPITPGTTILQGIRNAAPDARVTYSRLGDVPEGAQAAIVVIGEVPYAEMKGDRVSLELDPDDVATVKKVKASGLPTVVVLVSGRPMILEPILESADAVLAAWLPGSEGDGVADVLFGKYSPTGKLSHTWPRSMSQIPINVGPGGEKPAGALFDYGFGLAYGK